MRRRKDDPQQREIPFEDADAAAAERRTTLGIVLQRMGCDCQLSVLLQWVFNTEERTGKPLVKSYRELAQRPWGLCCSPSKARTTVGTARRKGVLSVEEQRYKSSDGQKANAYALDWAGISAFLIGRRVARRDVPREESSAPYPPGPGALLEHPPVSTAQGAVSTEHPPVSTAQPYIGNTLFVPSLDSLYKDSGSGSGPTVKGTKADALRAEILAAIPALAAAALREVRPLPPAETIYGAIRAITPRHLQDVVILVEWHRRQLGSPKPIGLATEADLVLVLAARFRATTMQQSEVRSSRIRVFCDLVGRGRWRLALPHVPEGLALLAGLQARYGADLLLRDDWPPAPLVRQEPTPATEVDPQPTEEPPAESMRAQLVRILHNHKENARC